MDDRTMAKVKERVAETHRLVQLTRSMVLHSEIALARIYRSLSEVERHKAGRVLRETKRV